MAIEAVPGEPVPTQEETDFANLIQAVFLERGMSLADPETAEAFRASLDAVDLMLRGAHGTELIHLKQYTALRDTLDAAQRVPDQI